MFCWIFRLMISSAVDGDAEFSAITRRHIRRCASCSQFHEMSLSMGEALRREAASMADDELPAQFGRRVLVRLRRMPARGGKKYKLPVRWSRPVVAAACVAIALLLGVFFLALPQDEPPTPEPGRILGLYKLMDDGHPTAWAGLVEKPLTDEIENLAEGTESAVRFLVACVAVDPTKAGSGMPN